jgi:hypothetical protein
MVTTKREAPPNLWDTPWAPDPATYYADAGPFVIEPVSPDGGVEAAPVAVPPVVRSGASASAAILNATSVAIEVANTHLTVRDGQAVAPSSEDDWGHRRWEPTREQDTPTRTRADVLAAAARAKKDRRNARDRAKRLRQYAQRVATGVNTYGPKPRGN